MKQVRSTSSANLPLSRIWLAAVAASLTLGAAQSTAAEPITIAHVYGKSGPFATYAQQSHQGLMLGLEYATGGRFEVLGRPVLVIEKDTRLQPALGKALLEEAYTVDQADLAVGAVSSRVALAMLPVAEANRKLLLVEPAVADTITGEQGNRYVFRTGRNTSQELMANAKALGRPGVKIAILAQDHPLGRQAVQAFADALVSTGADIVQQAFLPADTRDFAPVGEQLFDVLAEHEGERVVFFYWDGQGDPMGQLLALGPDKHNIRFATGGNVLAALAGYKPYPGLEGATSYYYQSPDNPVNDWLVQVHQQRFGTPPDFFTAGGMAAGIAIIEAIKQANTTETEALIGAMEGMRFETPKGTMEFRIDDHQAMQTMYHFRITVDPNVEWAVPELVREIASDELPLPVKARY